MAGQQSAAYGPARVGLATAATTLADESLADLGEHVVGQSDQVEPV